ncbi:hypothetical protein CC78DRAFT_36891 [Lojkania enalia]|uniref:CFEM domain-containing protein n=1 Tax=Lojkania enalia TaxID=147567 RepID=A0A9P4KJ72_9PLEO|nr:hypothetical protein CC78DRAFT_36891 [Didymosphaeria enalia]
MKASLALLISGLAAQQVSATWNRNAGHFNSPQYNNNECNDKQKDGFNWGDLPKGPFSGYSDFNFGGGGSGWSCADSFGKRDSLTKRTFNSRCIKNTVGKQKPATFDCSARKEGFSIKEIQVSVQFDCDLKFHYKMPDNSICKHTVPCKKDGTIVENTQCGGAKEVEVYLGDHKQDDQEGDCEIGFHHIDFDCNPGYTPPPKTSSPPETSTPSPPEYSTLPPEITSYSVPEESSTSEVLSETSELPVYSTSEVVEIPSSSSVFYSNSSIPVPTSTAAESSSGIEYVPSSTDIVPSSSAVESSGIEYVPSSSAVEIPSTTKSPAGETPIYTPSSSSSPQPSGPPGGYTPPECLPKCMNTWLELKSECKDNTDVNCYCGNKDFTKNVIDCVAAWATDEETKQALSYLIGICASYVPQNPGLITDCPSTVPIGPPTYAPIPPVETSAAPSGEVPSPPVTSGPVYSAPAPSAPVPAPPAGIPCTTITYETTITTESTTSTISTTITVPQVIFTTQTPAAPPAPGYTATQPVELVPGTPPPAPAYTTTPPYPIPSTLASTTIPAGTGSPVTSQPPLFTGAASSVSAKFTPAIFGAVIAFFIL